MNDDLMNDESIIQISDYLEQIKAVDQMIQIHKDDADDIMLSQYKYRRAKFVKEIGILLRELNIEPKELIAA